MRDRDDRGDFKQPARRRMRLAATALALWAAGGADLAAQQPKNHVVVLGQAHLADSVAPALAMAFAGSAAPPSETATPEGRRLISAGAADDPKLTIEIGASEASRAFANLASGSADIVLAARPASVAEAALFAAAGVDLRDEGHEQAVAIEAIAAIVSPRNPIPALSLRELAGIFSGAVGDWSALGGAPGPIAVYLPESFGPDSLAASVAPGGFGANVQRLPREADVAAAVAADPRAIGLTSLTRVGRARAAPIALDCGLVVEAGAFAAITREYPLSRQVLLYQRRSSDSAQAAELAAFAASDRARRIFRDAGMINDDLSLQNGAYLALRLVSAAAAATGGPEKAALKELAQVAQDAERLSATFRFREERPLLDAASLERAQAMARWLMLPENQRQTLHLLGFTARGGASDAALAKARDEAESVRRAILINAPLDFDPSRVTAAGFGATMPATCPDAPEADWINRRVEAWLTR